MLKDNLKQYILEVKGQASQNGDEMRIELFKEEREYIEKNSFLFDDLFGTISFIEKDPSLRFSDAVIERCDKETENLLANEAALFLNQPIQYLKKQKNEFIYLESKWFDLIRVESISLEADDVFGTYDVMLGLKLQKKFDATLKSFLNTNLHGEGSKFDLVFSHDDGLWDLNFALNYVSGFHEEMSIVEAYQIIYHLLFNLAEAVEMGRSN
jgi:hypothetical protein